MTSTARVHEPQATRAPSEGGDRQFGRQPLNAMDCAMHAVNAALQSMHSAGFETQALLWLRGRLDVGALRRAVTRLPKAYPVVASRLVERAWRTPYWEFRTNADCPLHESSLPTADLQGVLDHAGRLLSRPHDLGQSDPVSFHLLHLPDGRDVVLVQYNHVLMDNGAAVPLLRELDRLAVDGQIEKIVAEAACFRFPPTLAASATGSRGTRNQRINHPHEHDPVQRRDGDLIADYLAGYPRKRKMKAAWRIAKLRLGSLGGKCAQLPGKPPADPTRAAANDPLPVRIISQTLEPCETLALEERVRRVCRFPGLSMAVLASVFRGLHAAGPGRRGDEKLIAGIGLDLGLRDGDRPAFQNLASLVPVFAETHELDDGDELMLLLNRQLRDRLAAEIDLGNIQLASLFRSQRRFVRLFTHRLLRDGYSLWYAYFADLDTLGDSFCGAEVEDFLHVGPCWSSTGLTLIASRFRDRLHLQATCLPDVVPQATVDSMLRFIAEDLVGG